ARGARGRVPPPPLRLARALAAAQARPARRLSGQLPRFGNNLLEPVGHAHVAIHLRCRRDMLGRVLLPSGPTIELREAGVAMRDERTHTKLGRERERFAVRGLGDVAVADTLFRRDIPD